VQHTLCQVLKHGDKRASDSEYFCPCHYSQIKHLGLHAKSNRNNRNRKAIIKIFLNRKEYESLHPYYEALPGGGGGVHVARLNLKTSRVGVYKCFLLIVGLAVTVAIWPREVVSCRDFILCAVATFWAMSLVRIYPGRAYYIIRK